jgi:hypothetical protein
MLTVKNTDLSRSSERGMVFAEMAFGALGLAVLAMVLVGLFQVVYLHIQCIDAAGEVARQIARDDTAGAQAAQGELPDQAEVSVEQHGELVHVTVNVDCRPWGQYLPEITVTASAEVMAEAEEP